jgi:hypothetical protein
MKVHPDSSHSSRSELNFIRSLGDGKSVKIQGPKLTAGEIIDRQIRMLRGYLEALPMRDHWWDGAHPSKFEKEARKQLAAALRRKVSSSG